MGDEATGDAGAPRDRGAYLSQAYINAFGKYDEPDWDPDQGFAANRERIIKLYDYYRDAYLKRPDQFLWGRVGSNGWWHRGRWLGRSWCRWRNFSDEDNGKNR